MNAAVHAIVLTLVVALWAARPVHAAPGVVLQTSVAPEPGEDVTAPCHYELTLLDPARTIRGVWVIFDRGRDMQRYYGDPDVHAFARQHDLALLLAFHCRAKSSSGDINVEPGQGLGRALLVGLTQLAQVSKHPELASVGAILMGFSGTGALVARFPEFAPERVRAVIVAGAGHDDPVGMDTIRLSPMAASIPQMILVGSGDAVSGTQRPYEYFRRHFDQGAPWAFVVQNKTPHCCVINAKALVLNWLSHLSLRPFDRSAGLYAFIRTQPSTIETCPDPRPALVPPWCQSTKDNWGGANWQIASAAVEKRSTPPRGMRAAGWLPNRAVAREWLSFVTVSQHPITSLP